MSSVDWETGSRLARDWLDSLSNSWLGRSWSGTHEYFDWGQQKSWERQKVWEQPDWESQCWLQQELKRMADRRNETISKVRRARERVDELDEPGKGRRVLSPEMEAAVERLQAAMAAQDHQWRRQIMLDRFGIFVYDDEQGPNAGESVQLDVESRWYIINQLAQNYNHWRGDDYDGPPTPRDPPPGDVPPPDLPGHGWSQAASATSSQNYAPPPGSCPSPVE